MRAASISVGDNTVAGVACCGVEAGEVGDVGGNNESRLPQHALDLGRQHQGSGGRQQRRGPRRAAQAQKSEEVAALVGECVLHVPSKHAAAALAGLRVLLPAHRCHVLDQPPLVQRRERERLT